MPERRIVNAIVLRSVNYRDFDRILTLFPRMSTSRPCASAAFLAS